MAKKSMWEVSPAEWWEALYPPERRIREKQQLRKENEQLRKEIKEWEWKYKLLSER